MLVHSPQKQLILRNVCINVLQQWSADETLPNVVFGQRLLMVDKRPDNNFQRDTVKVGQRTQNCSTETHMLTCSKRSEVDVGAFEMFLFGEQNYKPIRPEPLRKNSSIYLSLFESMTPADDLYVVLEEVM